MSIFTRRTLVKGGTAAAAAAALTGPALLEWAKAWAQNAPWKPEKGAKLSMLRWKYFVQSEDDAFVKLIEAFTKATGVKIDDCARVIRRRAAKSFRRRQYRRRPGPVLGPLLVAASLPAESASTSPTLPTISARNTAAGCRARSPTAKERQQVDRDPDLLLGQHDQLPLEASKKAGFSKFPATTDEFLEYAKAMKKNKYAGRFCARSRIR